MIFLLAFAALAAAPSGWTSSVVWDAPADTPVRTVALVVDPSTGERLFALDVGQLDGSSPPTLRYVRWDGSRYTAPVVVSRSLWSTSEAYMPAIATGDGVSWLLVLSRAHFGRAVGTRSSLVHRDTGRVFRTSDGLRLDPEVSQGRAAVATDGVEAHACVAERAADGDDVVVNHTEQGEWARPDLGEDHVVALVGTQDHCTLALRPDGTRVVAHHGGSTPSALSVLLEEEVGLAEAGFPVEVQPPPGVVYNYPTVAVHPTPDGDELHLAFTRRESDTFTVVHTTCTARDPSDCSAVSDWSEAVEVAAPQTRNPHPQLKVDASGVAWVAWATDTTAGTATLAAASRCPGDTGFGPAELVDGIGEQGFGVATDGTVENHLFLSTTSLAVDDAAGTLHLAWVRRDGGRSVAVEGWRDLAVCEAAVRAPGIDSHRIPPWPSTPPPIRASRPSPSARTVRGAARTCW